MKTSMGVDMNAQETDSDYVRSLSKMQKIMQKRIFNPLIQKNWLFNLTPYSRKQSEYLNYINNHCNKVIAEKKQEYGQIDVTELAKQTDDLGRKKRMAFLDSLIISQRLGSEFTDQDILEEVNTFMFAGHDTTSSAIGFTCYCLGKFPHIQQKLYEELVSIYGTEPNNLTIKDLAKSEYLDMVVKESLRMFPPVSTYSRFLNEDLKLPSYVIPAGASVIVHAYTLHRNPEIYPKPDEFIPERFSKEASAERHPFAFVPFSAGPRNCIGQKYAMLELKLTIIDIVTNFELISVEPIKVNSYIILSANNGIIMKLKKRQHTN